MKVAAFRAVLEAAVGLYRDSGNQTAARALSLLARLLTARDAMTVAAFAALLASAPAADDSNAGQGGPTVAQLTSVLDMMQRFCQAAGAKAAEKDFKTLADALEARAAQPLEAFSAHVQAWLSEAAAKPKGRSKTTATKSAESNEEAIASHLAAFRNAGIDRSVFEAAFAALKADKSLKSPAVAEIARRYANTVTKYKSIAAAHADISSAFTERARFASKVG
jgi:exo-beta-1,3-glucanase (GH17 family)